MNQSDKYDEIKCILPIRRIKVRQKPFPLLIGLKQGIDSVPLRRKRILRSRAQIFVSFFIDVTRIEAKRLLRAPDDT